MRAPTLALPRYQGRGKGGKEEEVYGVRNCYNLPTLKRARRRASAIMVFGGANSRIREEDANIAGVILSGIGSFALCRK